MPKFRAPRSSETLVIPLSGNTARATEMVRRLVDPGPPLVFQLAELLDGRRYALRGRYERLALVGAPPTAEIGYGLAPVIAALGRPKNVALVDLEEETVAVTPLLAYIARSSPFAAGQLAASLAALVAQRVAISAVARRQSRVAGSSELRKLVYLLPVVGSASPVGGSITHAHEVIRALRSDGVEVEAFTNASAIAKTAAQEPEPPCSWRAVTAPRILKAVPASAAAGADAALVRAALSVARNADVIYQRHARFSLAGAVLARLAAKPLFLEYNGSQQFIGRHWNRTPLLQRLAACEEAALNAAARVIVVSEAERQLLLNRGVEPERIVVNPNGVAAQRFGIGGGLAIRQRHRLDPRALVIGFVGSFGPWHGAPVLARAFATVAGEIARAHLLLVGDGPELEATQSILRDAGLAAKVTATGQVPPADVPAYLDACDILVSPHVPLPDGVEFFGSPTKLFEYMAAGKAIAASRLGQIAEVLEHGVTAWLVHPGDASSLADGLRVLAEAPDLRRELGERARSEAVQHHGWSRNARRLSETYATFVEGENA